MKLRVLAVDWYLEHEAITNSSFIESPAFSDFDSVIINPRAIQNLLEKSPAYRDDRGHLTLHTYKDQGYGASLKQLFGRRYVEIEALLSKTRGVVLSMALPPDDELRFLDYHRDGGLAVMDSAACYDFMNRDTPFPRAFGYVVAFKSRVGGTLKILERNHPVSQYLLAFQSEFQFSCVIVPPKAWASRVIATDKVGDPIAVDIEYLGSRVVLLPSFAPKDQSKAGAILVNVIRRMLGHRGIDEPGPDWLMGYPVQGLGTFKQDIGTLSESIKILEGERSALERKEEQLKSFQILLYGQGKHVLEPIVREAFRLLGFDAPEPDDYEEDYDLRATCSEGQAIGEIEGVDNGPVNVDKYRQLLDYVNQEITKNNISYKGILIGNGHRLTDPIKRLDQFTADARRGCKSQGFCMIATSDLFRAVNAVLADPNDDSLTTKIRQSIMTTEGDWKFPA